MTDWEDISASEPLGAINTEGRVTHQLCRLVRNLSETNLKIDYAEYVENATINQLLGEYDENGPSTYYNSCLPGHLKLYGSRDKSFWCCTQGGWDDAIAVNLPMAQTFSSGAIWAGSISSGPSFRWLPEVQRA